MFLIIGIPGGQNHTWIHTSSRGKKMEKEFDDFKREYIKKCRYDHERNEIATARKISDKVGLKQKWRDGRRIYYILTAEEKEQMEEFFEFANQ
jgi:hypothetical protein